MIDICITHFGTKYNSRYITNLENGISRNYSGDFNLIIKTDCPNGHWDKISFFECDKPRIIMDIDFIINGNLDDLIDYDIPLNHIGAFTRWWRNGGCKINGGFYKINPSINHLAAYDKFYANPEFWINHYGNLVGTKGMGEQNFVEDSMYYIDELPGQWLGIYTEGSKRYQQNILNKYYDRYNIPLMTQNKFGKEIKLIHFIYDDNMIEDKPQWVQDLWNIM
tara:strand:- start:4800 stop:5465 length:666 start_codon:yes stop_codon:yes gene_type:complete